MDYEFLQDNFLYIFIGIAVVWVLIFIVIKVLSVKKKRNFKAANKDVAELTFDGTVELEKAIDKWYFGFVVYGVDGKKPNLINKCLFLTPGAHTLDVDYFVVKTGASWNTKNRTTHISQGRREFPIAVETGGKYLLKYNLLAEQFELDRIN